MFISQIFFSRFLIIRFLWKLSLISSQIKIVFTSLLKAYFLLLLLLLRQIKNKISTWMWEVSGKSQKKIKLKPIFIDLFVWIRMEWEEKRYFYTTLFFLTWNLLVKNVYCKFKAKNLIQNLKNVQFWLKRHLKKII